MAESEVVFVGHDGTRTGAPLMFLYFLRWLREHTDLAFSVVLVDGGPLVAEFEAVAPVIVLEDERGSWLVTTLERLGLTGAAERLVGRRERAALRHLGRVPTVYCNSIVSARVLGLLGAPRPSRLVVTHVHEMEGGFAALAEETLALMLAETDRFVAASDLVADVLVGGYGVDRDTISRHYEFIDVAALVTQLPPPAALAEARALCGIPATARVVGAVGVTQWRKGPDLYLLLAKLIEHAMPDGDVHFVWLGALPEATETAALHRVIEQAGLADRVHLVGPDPKPARWFALFDVFVLTSREDPFPLVCLESSLLGVPIVCFDNTGMAEFAGDGDCGFIVDYLDVAAMATRVRTLLEDDELRRAVGQRAATRVREEFDVRVGAPALYADLQTWRAGA